MGLPYIFRRARLFGCAEDGDIISVPGRLGENFQQFLFIYISVFVSFFPLRFSLFFLTQGVSFMGCVQAGC